MRFGKKWQGEWVHEMVAQDPMYCRWLINVPLFRDHHPAAYAQVREAVIKQLQLEQAEDLV
jgi:hypothetical protein